MKEVEVKELHSLGPVALIGVYTPRTRSRGHWEDAPTESYRPGPKVQNLQKPILCDGLVLLGSVEE